jgi:hypothetical protein
MAQDHLPQQAAPSKLLDDIRRMIEEARSKLAVTVNVGMTLLHWRIGERISEEIIKGDRAEYGKQIFATLSKKLSVEYGRGFNYSALTRMVSLSKPFLKRRLCRHCRHN